MIDRLQGASTEGIQKRADQFDHRCPRGCGRTLHAHGGYERYDDIRSGELVWVPRFLCYVCGLTISVLPSHLLPYRSVQVERLEEGFDRRAGIGSGPDPPPDGAEEGCMKRAWQRLASRVPRLRGLLGQLLPAAIGGVEELWLCLRRSLSSLREILRTLAELGKASLLGDYRCLRLPPPRFAPG